MKPLCLRGDAGRATTFELYPSIRLKTEEKSVENLSQCSRKVPVGHNSFGRLGGRFTGDLDRSAGRHDLWLAPLVTWVTPRSDIYRAAELRGSPHQLTSSRNAQSGL